MLNCNSKNDEKHQDSSSVLTNNSKTVPGKVNEPNNNSETKIYEEIFLFLMVISWAIKFPSLLTVTLLLLRFNFYCLKFNDESARNNSEAYINGLKGKMKRLKDKIIKNAEDNNFDLVDDYIEDSSENNDMKSESSKIVNNNNNNPGFDEAMQIVYAYACYKKEKDLLQDWSVGPAHDYSDDDYSDDDYSDDDDGENEYILLSTQIMNCYKTRLEYE
jgi:hypothetical protein